MHGAGSVKPEEEEGETADLVVTCACRVSRVRWVGLTTYRPRIKCWLASYLPAHTSVTARVTLCCKKSKRVSQTCWLLCINGPFHHCSLHLVPICRHHVYMNYIVLLAKGGNSFPSCPPTFCCCFVEILIVVDDCTTI